MSQIPGMIQALLKPEAYPHRPSGVEMVQTQMSFLFLAGDYVYKLKKPVDLGYLDYTTLEKRKYFCDKEVELNRRLCPDTYLGVVSVTRNSDGFSFEGKDEAVEYAIKMRRLPKEGMLDMLLSQDKVSPEMLARVAHRLADFHQSAETNATISAFGELATIRQNTEENFAQTEKYIGVTISRRKFDRIASYTRGFIKTNAPLFSQRIADGRIRDCHGDLHAAHICFTDGICIYDCIEFNDRFRYSDVAAEVAFLAMDLDHYGRADLSRRFISAYFEIARDGDLLKLLNFYKCYRAYVRGKVESFKLDDPYIAEAEKKPIAGAASRYFDLAEAYAKPGTVLFITTGLVGTGKTAIAKALAKRLGLVVLSSDVIRKQLASVPATEHRFESFGAGIYTPEFSRRTYDEMFAQAKQVLVEGGPVILDAAFIRSSERQKAQALARETDADFFIIECTLDEETVKQRLARRLERGTVSDGRWEIYAPQKSQFEPVREVPPENYIRLDTGLPLDENIRQVLAHVE